MTRGEKQMEAPSLPEAAIRPWVGGTLRGAGACGRAQISSLLGP